MKRPLALFCLLCAMLAMTACASTSFTKTGINPPAIKPSPDCDPNYVVVLQKMPSYLHFVELGSCNTTDNTPNAVERLKRCACQNGGNAIVLYGDTELSAVGSFGYSLQRVKDRAAVLFVTQ